MIREIETMRALVAIGAAFLAAVVSGTASAQSVAEFYQGKQIEFIVTGDAGTQNDKWARLLARHVPKFMPGAPTFVVKTMPGGGHITGANHLYNNALKDGTVIGITSRNVPTIALLGNDAVKYDVTKFNWLGSSDFPSRICVVRPDAPAQSGEDLFQKELKVGGAGAGSTVSTTPTILASVLGMKFKLIEGYKSPVETILAVERGEVEGMCLSLGGIEQLRPGFMTQGKLKVLFNLEKNPIKNFPGVSAPTIYKFVNNEEHRQIIAFYSANVELGRPIFTPPGVPADRVAALKNAFEAALKDEAVIKDAEREKLDYAPITGAELKARVDSLMATPRAIIDRTISLIGAAAL
jgi:tripartite-type tricarboxylate transporter receptor subunit TctC